VLIIGVVSTHPLEASVVTTANKVRLAEPKQAPTQNKNSGFINELKFSLLNWFKTLGMSDRAPINRPEKRLKFGGTFRIDEGIQELNLPNGYTVLSFDSTAGLQISLVNAHHRTMEMTFKESIYSLPPLHIYSLADGGTREVCGDMQKIFTADGFMIVLDTRGVVLVSNGNQTEQFRRPYASNTAQCMSDQRLSSRSH
jgi:hypothetical protein